MNHPLTIIRTIRESFMGSSDVYTKGSCYKFYLILKSIFPQSEAYYDCDHVITEIDGCFYDINGKAEKTDRHLKISEHFTEEHYSIKHTIFDIYGLQK